MPNFLLSSSNRYARDALVIIFAVWTAIGQYTSLSIHFITWSLKKWNVVSMCFLFPWDTEFLARLIADLLSIINSTCCSTSILNSANKDSNHRPCEAAYLPAICSVSHEDSAISDCFLKGTSETFINTGCSNHMTYHKAGPSMRACKETNNTWPQNFEGSNWVFCASFVKTHNILK